MQIIPKKIALENYVKGTEVTSIFAICMYTTLLLK